MPEKLFVKIHEKDNVAIALRDLPAGTRILRDVVTRQDIPQAHKIALTRIPRDGRVFMTGRGTPYGLEIAPVIKVCSHAGAVAAAAIPDRHPCSHEIRNSLFHCI